jgi:hypothetical protein
MWDLDTIIRMNAEVPVAEARRSENRKAVSELYDLMLDEGAPPPTDQEVAAVTAEWLAAEGEDLPPPPKG